jgi:hypothetical protein
MRLLIRLVCRRTLLQWRVLTVLTTRTFYFMLVIVQLTCYLSCLVGEFGWGVVAVWIVVAARMLAVVAIVVRLLMTSVRLRVPVMFLCRLRFSMVPPFLTGVIAVSIAVIVFIVMVTTVVSQIIGILSVIPLMFAVVAVAIVGTLILIAADITSTIAVRHLINGSLAIFVSWTRPTSLLLVWLLKANRVSALKFLLNFLIKVFDLYGTHWV